MKKILSVIASLFIGLTLMAQPPNVPADKGVNFGVSTSATGAVKATELHVFLAGKEKAEVKVEGKVSEVCKAEGCWLRMETASGTMLVKMKDHKFLVPLALNGKTIIAEGTATMKETTVDMLRHYAEDAGKSKEEIAKITEPKKEMVLQAKGILVL
ncbi:MAG: DUF4920 domain-containing protein [Ferruginibacter sp.]